MECLKVLWLKNLVLILTIYFAAADYDKYVKFLHEQSENVTFVRLFEEHVKLFQCDGKNLRDTPTFHCKTYPQPMPVWKTTSVHKLTPADIKVIAAMGDSITAGTGIKARTVLGLLTQDRGLSWSIGGDKAIGQVETVANMLKVYNPDVNGYSTGWGPVWWEGSSQLNVANPGDRAKDMPGQAIKLVERMKKNENINFNDDWKLITLFVGGNDLCDYCDNKDEYKAEKYIAHIQESLDYLHANVPRAFVNLVEVLDVSIVKTLNENLICDVLHKLMCNCAAYPKDSQAEAELKVEVERYRNLTNQLIGTGRYDTREDFTVVIQPFFEKTQPPTKVNSAEPDLTYFAPDCFHLSLIGHRAAADALWNNMIEPVGRKRLQWKPRELVECPSASAPYLYTYKNSGGSSANQGVFQSEERDTKMESNFETHSDERSETESNSSGYHCCHSNRLHSECACCYCCGCCGTQKNCEETTDGKI